VRRTRRAGGVTPGCGRKAMKGRNNVREFCDVGAPAPGRLWGRCAGAGRHAGTKRMSAALDIVRPRSSASDRGRAERGATGAGMHATETPAPWWRGIALPVRGPADVVTITYVIANAANVSNQAFSSQHPVATVNCLPAVAGFLTEHPDSRKPVTCCKPAVRDLAAKFRRDLHIASGIIHGSYFFGVGGGGGGLHESQPRVPQTGHGSIGIPSMA
jgi:hypothetical protein